MKRAMMIVALVAFGLAGCGKEQPKPAAAPAAPITPAPATTDAAKDTAKTSAEAPKVEAAKTEASKDAKK
jgi:hypothetical protein